MQRDRESQEVGAAAQRFVKSGDRSDLESYSTEALKKADYQFSNRDERSGYRQAIKDLIEERAETAQGKKDSLVRSIGYIVALAIAIIAGAVVVIYL